MYHVAYQSSVLAQSPRFYELALQRHPTSAYASLCEPTAVKRSVGISDSYTNNQPVDFTLLA